MRKIIESNPQAVARIFSLYNILQPPTFDNFLAAYIVYGDDFLFLIYSDIFGTKAFVEGADNPTPESEDKKKRTRKQRDWTKFRKEAGGWVNLAANLTSAGVGVFRTIQGDETSSTEISYSDDEYGFDMKTRINEKEESFLEKNALYIGLGVVVLLFLFIMK